MRAAKDLERAEGPSIKYVNGSHGEISYVPSTGEVVGVNSVDNEYQGISNIDIEEYKKFWGVSRMPVAVDILNVGYWFENGKYEPPVFDWRQNLPNLFLTLNKNM